MTDDWPQRKARLDVASRNLNLDYPLTCSIAVLAADIRAALQRVELYAQQEDAIRSEFGWKRDGRPLIECLRQRVEELEREKYDWQITAGAEQREKWREQKWLEDWRERAEAAEAKLAKVVEALGEIRGRSLAAKTHEVGPLEAKGRLTRILELACAALAAAKGD